MSLSKLQEMVKDREAWCVSIYKVTKSRTWLSNWTTKLLAIPGNICKIIVFTSSTPPHLRSIKEPGIQTWTSLPSSLSAAFQNKGVFLAFTPHLSVNWPVSAASTWSLDSVTVLATGSPWKSSDFFLTKPKMASQVAASGKDPACQCRLDVKRHGFDHWARKIPWRIHSRILAWIIPWTGTWWAAVHIVTQSQSQLKQLSMNMLYYAFSTGALSTPSPQTGKNKPKKILHFSGF